MNIEITEINEIPRPVLAYEEGSRKVVLEDFLFDARTDIDGYLNEISKAEENDDVPTGFTSNQVDASFFPNKAEIEHLWTEDENGELIFVEIPLTEARQLLLEWKRVLNNWYQKNSR